MIKDNEWGRKLVANEIRPLIYKITESFKKYEAVKDYEQLTQRISYLNDVLKNDKLLESLNELSKEKYEIHQRIKKEQKIKDQINGAKEFKNRINNFDHEKELNRVRKTFQCYFSLDDIQDQVDESLLDTDPDLYHKLKKVQVDYAGLSIGDRHTKRLALKNDYKILQADFIAYYIIQHIKDFNEIDKQRYFTDMKEKKYVDSTISLPEEMLAENQFIYSYVRIDESHINSIHNYFYFEEPEYDISQKIETLKKEMEETTNEIHEILFADKGDAEVIF